MNTTRSLILFLALALLGLVLLALSAPTARAADPVIIRVTTSGTTTWPCGDQTNWSNPCALQTALSNTVSGSELWIAAGTYKPTTGADRFASFQLRDGVALYGGFAGGETMRSQRNITANVTILSGDLKGNDNSNVQWNEPTRSDNSEHVVVAGWPMNTSLLDGFTVTGGNATLGDGGGMCNSSGNPVLMNVIFISNTAGSWAGGGGMYSWGSPVLTNVTFTSNSAPTGGGMSSWGNSSLTNVTFSGNSATDGGGMYNLGSSPMLTNVTFSDNRATNYGGAMYNGGAWFNADRRLSRMDSAFSSPSATLGDPWYQISSPTINNTIFWGNSALAGSQIYNAPDYPDPPSTAYLYYGIVQGGCPDGSATCTNILTADPRLGPLGYWGGGTQTIPLLVGSSAIDTGNDATCPPTDQRGVPRPQGAHCDIGAFEGVLSLLNLPLIGR